jgi:hypothetical protein
VTGTISPPSIATNSDVAMRKSQEAVMAKTELAEDAHQRRRRLLYQEICHGG